ASRSGERGRPGRCLPASSAVAWPTSSGASCPERARVPVALRHRDAPARERNNTVARVSIGSVGVGRTARGPERNYPDEALESTATGGFDRPGTPLRDRRRAPGARAGDGLAGLARPTPRRDLKGNRSARYVGTGGSER